MKTETTKLSKQELQIALAGYTGTQQYYLHRIPTGLTMNLTDGCAFVREHASAWWLFDLILSFQIHLKQHHFQVWNLIKQGDGSWFIQCTDGNENFLAAQEIAYSDFPLDKIEVWLIDGVCLLPSEY